MTVIVGLHTEAGTWMGADGRTIYADGSICRNDTTKLLRAGDWCLGLAGQGRGLYLVERALSALVQNLPVDLDDAVEAICWGVRRIMIDDGWKPIEDPGKAPGFDLSFLLGHPEGLWTVSRQLCPSPVVHETRGSGMDYAQGAVSALRATGGFSPEDIVRRAVEVAIRHDTGCGGEPVVVSLPRVEALLHAV